MKNNSSVLELVDLLKTKHLTLGSIESLTGGLFAATMTSIPGASKFFKGALVTYYTEEKVRLLGLDEDYVNKYGVVNKEVAIGMARNGKTKLATDLAISFTGNAGPDAMDNQPVGTVFVGISFKNETNWYLLNLEGDRDSIRNQCVIEGANLLISTICKNF